MNHDLFLLQLSYLRASLSIGFLCHRDAVMQCDLVLAWNMKVVLHRNDHGAINTPSGGCRRDQHRHWDSTISTSYGRGTVMFRV